MWSSRRVECSGGDESKVLVVGVSANAALRPELFGRYLRGF